MNMKTAGDHLVATTRNDIHYRGVNIRESVVEYLVENFTSSSEVRYMVHSSSYLDFTNKV